jgi:hypothetical protein
VWAGSSVVEHQRVWSISAVAPRLVFSRSRRPGVRILHGPSPLSQEVSSFVLRRGLSSAVRTSLHGESRGFESHSPCHQLLVATKLFAILISKIAFLMKSTSGRRVFASAVKAKGRPMLERCEVRMLAQVTTTGARTPRAERLRFPVQCQSEQG